MSATPFFIRGLNRLLKRSPGATGQLLRHAGQVVRFSTNFKQWDVQIADDGALQEIATESPDASIHLPPGLLARLPFSGRGALRDAAFEGDPALLQTLDKVFGDLRWDVEADLAPFIGDSAAHRAVTTGRGVLRTVRHAAVSLQGNVSEYMVEEIALMARKVDVNRFNGEVDILVDEVARLEARIKRLDAPPS